ncbi:MAG: hypothetical protein DHS20C01_31680 [marine bacterium B5-7]|nr:MAG: hypothetical protein DHS20C01_31680 [marine bacterium B5-7]
MDYRLALIPPEGGSYALIFRCNHPRRVQIGKLGTVVTEPGYYVYCGTAFGSGGLRARIGRHLTLRRNKHWHIDYLRPFLKLERIWYSRAPHNLEHRWSDRLLDIAFVSGAAVLPLARFGASDCRCPTHLVRLPFRPDLQSLRFTEEGEPGVVEISWNT